MSSEHTDMDKLQYLNDQVERYYLICMELKKENKVLLENLKMQEKKQKENNDFLRTTLAANKEKKKCKSPKPNIQLEEKRQAHSKWKQEKEERINQLQSKIKNQVVDLEENEKLTAELRQRVFEEEHYNELLRKEIAEQEATSHRLKLDFEKISQSLPVLKENLEKTKLENPFEMVRACNRKLSEALQSPEILNCILKKLGYLQSRKEYLKYMNRGLMRKITSLSLQKSAEEKDIEPLMEKCQELEVEKIELIKGQDIIWAENEILSKRISKALEVYHQEEATAKQLQEELEGLSIKRRHLEELKEEAAITVRHILESPETLSEAHWKTMTCVEILERATQQQTGVLSNYLRKARRGWKRDIFEPNPVRNENLSSSSNSSDPTPQQ